MGMADNHEPTEQDLEAKGQDPNNGGQDPQPDRQAGPDKSTPDDVVQSELKRAREEAAAARVKLREYERDTSLLAGVGEVLDHYYFGV